MLEFHRFGLTSSSSHSASLFEGRAAGQLTVVEAEQAMMNLLCLEQPLWEGNVHHLQQFGDAIYSWMKHRDLVFNASFDILMSYFVFNVMSFNAFNVLNFLF